MFKDNGLTSNTICFQSNYLIGEKNDTFWEKMQVSFKTKKYENINLEKCYSENVLNNKLTSFYLVTAEGLIFESLLYFLFTIGQSDKKIWENGQKFTNSF